jgi:hypothetical protein
MASESAPTLWVISSRLNLAATQKSLCGRVHSDACLVCALHISERRISDRLSAL